MRQNLQKERSGLAGLVTNSNLGHSSGSGELWGGPLTGPKNAASNLPSLDRSVQDELGVFLQDMYGTLIEEPLPERLLALIEQLEAPGGATEGAREGEP